MLVLFTFVDRRIGEYVNRWIFRAPDYRTLLRSCRKSWRAFGPRQRSPTPWRQLPVNPWS